MTASGATVRPGLVPPADGAAALAVFPTFGPDPFAPAAFGQPEAAP